MNWHPAAKARSRNWMHWRKRLLPPKRRQRKPPRNLKDMLAARQKAETALQKAEAELQLVRNQQTDLEAQIKEKQSAAFCQAG